MVSAISFGWFAVLENPLPLFNVHPNRFRPTNGKHPRIPGVFLKSIPCQVTKHYEFMSEFTKKTSFASAT